MAPAAAAPAPSTAGWLEIPVPAAPAVAPTRLRCWWEPSRRGPAPAAVLVLPEVFGVNDWVRRVAGRLAAEGYDALALPLYARTAPELDLPYDEASLAEGREHKERTTAPQILADVAAAAGWLQAAGPRPLGCVGFCFGGHAALLAATLPAITATADFYGAGVASGRPGGVEPTLEEVPRVPGRLLCVCGSRDPLIPAADAAAIRAALEAAGGGRHRYLELEAGHGFLCDARADHAPQAAAQAWDALLEFFAASLGPAAEAA
ncbi:MAG: dienelactone hydrolase family protein [Synechococcus sp.]|nr:dienelactone hydrolase family protein [Synechococcus sp.]